MTYSIVARDPSTGRPGVGVQSHYFGVGRIVPWAEAGDGAGATQSFAEPSYGPLGLDLMREGATALAELVRRETIGHLGRRHPEVTAFVARLPGTGPLPDGVELT